MNTDGHRWILVTESFPPWPDPAREGEDDAGVANVTPSPVGREREGVRAGVCWMERAPRTFVAPCAPELGRDELPLVLADRQVGPTQFMESFHDSEIMHCDHEPWDWSAEHRLGVCGRDYGLAPRRCSALRFMGSFHGFKTTHWDHEPATAALTPALSHRMGEGVRLVRRSLGEGGRTGLRRAEVASATQAGEGRFMGSNRLI
jgi:hypothetical protein